MATEAERLQFWEDWTDGISQCMKSLDNVLLVPGVTLMGKLFATQGFILGQKTQQVHEKILRAYILEKKTLDHVGFFFLTIGC